MRTVLATLSLSLLAPLGLIGLSAMRRPRPCQYLLPYGAIVSTV